MKNIKFIHLLVSFTVIFITVPICHAELSANLLNQAKKGKASAQYAVARSYELGKRVKSDKAKAIEWYTKAADQGHAESGYRLGLIYYKGIGGFKTNPPKAFHYLSMAAKANHKRSQAHLAEMYENGEGVKQNDVMSDYWYEQAFTSSTQPLSQYLANTNKQSVVIEPVVNKNKAVKQQAAPVSVKTAVSSYHFPQSIINKNWFQGSNPSMYLQSTGSKCKLKNGNIECVSGKLKTLLRTGFYKFKVKSIISRGDSDKSIKVVYRKLYTSVPTEAVDAYADDEATSAGTDKISIGWEKKSHSFSCVFETDNSLLCRPVGEDAFYIKSRF
ncbi:MAG: sel1 repeat family protein [Gammaproteobacteria bacterium]|nr:sel1 repeat family protein [Gammaproteobacteria bacterium]